jgi:hypothetical protein
MTGGRLLCPLVVTERALVSMVTDYAMEKKYLQGEYGYYSGGGR